MNKISLAITVLWTSSAMSTQIEDLNWKLDQGIGAIGSVGKISLSRGYAYLDVKGTDEFLKMNGNPPNGQSYTVAPTHLKWFGILQFEKVGYVKDDEELDSDALLETLQANTRASNEHRNKLGYESLTMIGWASPPKYDPQTKRLEWGTMLESQDGSRTVNMTTKILGRSGYVRAILVTNPDHYREDWVDFKRFLTNFEYNEGERYSEWKSGDKVAAYGLGALILGGAAAAATSKGGIKAILAAVAAGIAGLWALIKRFSGSNK